jgi:Sec-independent protein secretion pathway component TatC
MSGVSRFIAGAIVGCVVTPATYFLGFEITWKLCLLLFIAMWAAGIADSICRRHG